MIKDIKKKGSERSMNTADRIIISGSIKAVGEFSEVQGIGFSLTLTAQGEPFASSKRELLNKILTPVLMELAREEELQ